jgi:hypothetical protein
MDPIEKIASLIKEDEFTGAANAPMASKVVPFVFQHLSELNANDLKFERMEGNTIFFTVIADGKSHQYKMAIDYAGSTKPGPVGEAY